MSLEAAERAIRDADLGAALRDLQDQVRQHPSNPKLRVFLFQLLCVLGEWERALTQLNVAAELDAQALGMAQMYRDAVQCEALRAAVFAGQRSPMIFGEPSEWLALLELAEVLAGLRGREAVLRGRRAAMVFWNSSLRTRTAFEVACFDLGAHAVYLQVGGGLWQLEHRDGVMMDGLAAEHVKEGFGVLSRMLDGVGVRVFAGLKDAAEDAKEPVLTAIARASSVPITTRSGFMKSSTAAPSFRNSGFDTTANGMLAPRAVSSAAMVFRTRSAVPTGTVDLSTTILNSVIRRPMSRAAASTYCMSAEPSSPGGVPTAMNCRAPCATAASASVVNLSRPASALRRIIGSSPGSWIGTPPPLRVAIFAASTSKHNTSLPTSARQVPVTRPT
jgi:hypothetical protein